MPPLYFSYRELVEEAVVDDLHCPVGLVDIYQDGHLDLAGAEIMLILMPTLYRASNILAATPGLWTMPALPDGDLGNFVVDITCGRTEILCSSRSCSVSHLNAHGEADILCIAADGLEYEVHIDPLLGQQGEDLESDAGSSAEALPATGIFIAGYAADVQFFHGFATSLTLVPGLPESWKTSRLTP